MVTIMNKFTEKSLHSYPLAYFYAAMQSFEGRIAAVASELTKLNTMRQEYHRLFEAFDSAYKNSLKSQLTDIIKKKDKERDNIVFVMERVAKLWAKKLDDETLSIHGRRIYQIFKNYNFRTMEAMVAENAKILSMEEQFQESIELENDLAVMGLTELNLRLATLTNEIVQLMNQRSEEQSVIVVGEMKAAREALDDYYHAFIIYLNAVQEIQPEDDISLAAQFYNEDIRKIDQQIAQSRKKKKDEDGDENGVTSKISSDG